MDKTWTVLLAAGWAIAAHASAEPPTAVVAGRPLVRAGSATVRVAGLLPLFDAVLYLADPADAGRVLDDVPKRLEIRYRRSISAALLNRAADRALAATLPEAALVPLRERIQRIASLYRDVGPGDVYELVYRPGRGTDLLRNGEPVGRVDGADFARAYFGIWLHPRSPHAALREGLLGG